MADYLPTSRLQIPKQQDAQFPAWGVLAALLFLDMEEDMAKRARHATERRRERKPAVDRTDRSRQIESLEDLQNRHGQFIVRLNNEK